MTVIPFAPERRRQRSTNVYEAIKFQLEEIYSAKELRNLTIGDSRGLLLAYAGHIEEAQVLAAYAPLMSRVDEKDKYHEVMERVRGFIPDAASDTLSTRSFVIDGEELFITLIGAPGKLEHNDLYHAVSGIKRILISDRFAA
jgi:hypothetical protein